jgi:hypothetical protein
VEEAGLVVTNVLGNFEKMHYKSRSGKHNIQMNFVVLVDKENDIRLCPEEHSKWKWIDETGIEGLDCTPEMAGVLVDAFKWAEKIPED